MVAELIEHMKKEDFLLNLATSIHLLPFEARKDSQTIFSYVLRFRPPNSIAEDAPALAYVIDERPEIIATLCRGYANKDSSMPCGVVLREILKHEPVTALILHDQSAANEPSPRYCDLDTQVPQSGHGVFWEFFDYIDKSVFEVSADAFNTFRVGFQTLEGYSIAKSSIQEILVKHKPLVAQWLIINFDLFFQRYNSVLIESKSYLVKRQSIKLLGEILLDRANYNVMTEFVSRGEHLKLCMNQLRDDRKMIQYEGFHVFKVCYL